MLAIRLALTLACATATGAMAIRRDVAAAPSTQYAWSQETDSAAFDGAYNFPVFVVRGEMWALHPRGNWSSGDGRLWTRSTLPLSGLNAGYQKYVSLDGAVYALGTMTGNYLDLH